MTMMSYDEFTTQDRRLVLLRALADSARYRGNAYLLQRYAEQMGHSVSTDRVASDLAWLQEQGLVTVTQVDGVTLATLNQRGLDVAQGTATVPGVKRPQPGF